MRILGFTIVRTSELECERSWSKVQADDLRACISELRGSLDESREQLAKALNRNVEMAKASHDRECQLKAENTKLSEAVKSLEARIRDLTSPVKIEDCIHAVEQAAEQKRKLAEANVSLAKDIARKAREARTAKGKNNGK